MPGLVFVLFNVHCLMEKNQRAGATTFRDLAGPVCNLWPWMFLLEVISLLFRRSRGPCGLLVDSGRPTICCASWFCRSSPLLFPLTPLMLLRCLVVRSDPGFHDAHLHLHYHIGLATEPEAHGAHH